MNFKMAEPEPTNPIAAMIAPGRRALGEDWNRTTFHWNPDTQTYDVKTEATEAPADGKSIFLPTLGNVPYEMVNWILDYQVKQAEYRAARGPQEMTQEERTKLLNEMWQDYMSEKLKWFNGQTQIGPGGMSQREKVNG